MYQPTNSIVPKLRKLRANNATLEEQTQAVLAFLDRRVGTSEHSSDSFGLMLKADKLFGKLVTREFERRIADLERRVHELEHGSDE